MKNGKKLYMIGEIPKDVTSLSADTLPEAEARMAALQKSMRHFYSTLIGAGIPSDMFGEEDSLHHIIEMIDVIQKYQVQTIWEAITTYDIRAYLSYHKRVFHANHYNRFRDNGKIAS